MKLFTEIHVLCCIVERPKCSFLSKCEDEMWNMSCTLRYSANATYVFVDMLWSATEESDKVKMNISTSENIATATSTLTVRKPDDDIPVYQCYTQFNLKSLPDGFAKDLPEYNEKCSLANCKSRSILEMLFTPIV